jgi:hypothetical protein
LLLLLCCCCCCMHMGAAGYVDDAPNSSWVDPLLVWFKVQSAVLRCVTLSYMKKCLHQAVTHCWCGSRCSQR